MDAAAHHRLSEVRRLVVHLVVRLSCWVRAWTRGGLVQETGCLSTIHRSRGALGAVHCDGCRVGKALHLRVKRKHPLLLSVRFHVPL